ncbi:hypothetical protein [Phaffia rhodozyma]|uniref:Uncharacterized protein n=1 Tax=Phaffia rhodozyma TaxID=264483 RepID=A0A0F7SIH4_PHARH|nr:hypothetical protein [Phaffia rhodozyma]
MRPLHTVWQTVKLAFGISVLSAGIEAQTGLRPQTHLLGNEYNQQYVADGMLQAGRVALWFAADAATRSGYFAPPAGKLPPLNTKV